MLNEIIKVYAMLLKICAIFIEGLLDMLDNWYFLNIIDTNYT